MAESMQDFSFYENDRFMVLQHTVHSNTYLKRALDILTYRTWVEQKHTFPVIKIEGLEHNPQIYQTIQRWLTKHHTVVDIHGFVSNNNGYSFKWHQDLACVVLLVLTGSKRVFIKNKCYHLNAGDSVVIPRKHIHRVFSQAGTTALSIGIK
jgi:mannose-6-phosphate isomerase-like protein (cupin superfamily)